MPVALVSLVVLALQSVKINMEIIMAMSGTVAVSMNSVVATGLTVGLGWLGGSGTKFEVRS